MTGRRNSTHGHWQGTRLSHTGRAGANEALSGGDKGCRRFSTLISPFNQVTLAMLSSWTEATLNPSVLSVYNPHEIL